MQQVTNAEYVSKDGNRLAKVLDRGPGYRVIMLNMYFENTYEKYFDELSTARECANLFVAGNFVSELDFLDSV